MSRRNRNEFTREELLAEIEYAEAILDGCEADEGLTLWGRIASIKSRLTKRAIEKHNNGNNQSCRRNRTAD